MSPERLICCGKGLNESFVIGLAFQVGGREGLGSVDAVLDRQPNEHDAIADAIERSPPETTERFEHWVPDFTDDFGRL